ncbi:MAG: DUF1003 domain-containing protein [Caulobacteraceae bacterium]
MDSETRHDQPPPHLDGLTPPLARNIFALERHKREERAQAAFGTRVADAITRFIGGVTFVCLQLAVVLAWVLVNLGAVPGLRPFDRAFTTLATVASLEAIFLSTLVLISQNRAEALAEKHAALNLQMTLLTEHEVTRLIALVADIARKVGVEETLIDQVDELQKDVVPETVLEKMNAGGGGSARRAAGK